MKSGQGIDVAFGHASIGERQIASLGKRLLPTLAAMRETKKYSDEYASLCLPSDTKLVRASCALASRFRDTELLIVVGIGGSNLGTMAVQEALQGRLHNETGTPRVYYADTTDPVKTATIDRLLDSALAKRRSVVVNVISKSGSTAETIANFEVFLATLQRRLPNAASRVVVTTDDGSPLAKLAAKEGFATLPIPRLVGGRYSVLSPVGLFPLALLGIDVEALLAGANAMRERCLTDEIAKNPAAQGAIAHYIHAGDGRNISDLFLFSPDLESVGKWWRQLLAESCGKEFDRTGKKQVFVGITPTVTIGSTDLHSAGQLALGGPQDKFTTFVSFDEGKEEDVRVPDFKGYERLVPSLQGRRFSTIMSAIEQGTRLAYEKGGRPYCSITLPNRGAYALGQLLQLKMMETMLLGALLGVNPFDQPAVEKYKVETKRILAQEAAKDEDD